MKYQKTVQWYKRIILLVVCCIFILFTLIYIIVIGLHESTSSKWILSIYNFILDLYPNIFIMPFAFLFPLVFYLPIREAERKEEEEMFIERIERKLIPVFRDVVIHEQRASDTLLKPGVSSIDEALDIATLKAKIASSRQRVFILENWICQNLNELEDAFREAISNNATLKILLLEPASAFAKQRSLDLGHEETYVSHLIRGNITSLKNLQKRLRTDNLEVRCHNSLPSLQIFICDNQALVGFFMHRVDSQYNPQLHVSMKDSAQNYTVFGKRIENEFEVIWQNAIPIALDE